MYAKKQYKKQQKRSKDVNENSSSSTFKYKCHKCKIVGHKASDCKAQKKDSQNATMLTSEAFLTGMTETGKWCLDIGATSHFCYKACKFGVNMNTKREKLNLANKNSTQIRRRNSSIEYQYSWRIEINSSRKYAAGSRSTDESSLSR